MRSRPLCEAMHFAQWAGQALSGMSLTALNIDKYVFFGHPLKYRLFTTKCAMAVSLVISLLSLGYVRNSFSFYLPLVFLSFLGLETFLRVSF